MAHGLKFQLPTCRQYGILWISWNFLFDGGEEVSTLFKQTGITWQNQIPWSKEIQKQLVQTNTKLFLTQTPPLIDCDFQSAREQLSQELLGKKSCDLQWIWSGMSRSLVFLCFHQEVKFTMPLWQETIWKHTFASTSRDITKCFHVDLF